MTEDPIEEIRRSLSTEREIKRRASDWKDQSGGDRVGRCTHPEHGHTSDKGGTPNLIVTDDDGWYCYSHSTGGGIFEWIAVEEGICSCGDLPLSDEEFKQSLTAAADRAGVDLGSGPSPDDYEEAQELESLSDYQMAQFALEEAVDILHDNLNSVIGDQTVRGLIKERRPFTDEVIDNAKIGYLDGQAHADMLERLSAEALRDIGLHRDNDSLHGTGRIIYPYYDGDKPSYWVGRKTDKSSMDAKYLKPHSDTTVFDQPIYEYTPDRVTAGEGVWVVEGIQDAIALSEHGGVKTISAVATNPSPKQLNQLVSRGQEAGRAVICFDADDGGQGDSVELALDLMSAGVQTAIAPLPDGTDPCDFFLDGGEFDELEAHPAAKRIIEVKGDSDPLIERILDTAEPETSRGERLVNSLAEVTPIRKTVLRKMMKENREYEQQRGWREPSMVKKTAGTDAEWTFVYPDGTEIEMSSITGRRSPAKFSDKYGAVFNFFPDISRSEWLEMVNEWMSEVRVEEVDPLSDEGRTRELVQEQIQSAYAVPDKDQLSAVGEEAVAYSDGESEILVLSSLLGDWLDEIDVGLRQAGEYLQPIRDGGTKRLRVDGVRKRFWIFDAQTIEDNGYALPDAKPPADTTEEFEESEEL